MTRIHPRIRRWLDDNIIETPIRTADGRIMEHLEGRCKCCGRWTQQPRGRLTVRDDGCLDIEWAGVCWRCRVVTPFHLHWHADGRISYLVDGWSDGKSKRSLGTRLRMAVRRVRGTIRESFYKFRGNRLLGMRL